MDVVTTKKRQPPRLPVREGPKRALTRKPLNKLAMLDKLSIKIIYILPYKLLVPALTLLMGSPFTLLIQKEGPPLLIQSGIIGLALATPTLMFIHHMRSTNRFWRLLGEARDVFSECTNLSDLNWLENGLVADLDRIARSEATREAHLMQLSELQKLKFDIASARQSILSEF